MITDSWRGSPALSVSKKLSSTRSAISAWNKTQQRNSQEIIEQKKRELNAALVSPSNDTALIQDIATKLNAAYLAEEEYWRQRSRLLWLKLGDRNTGYFHAITKSRKRANAFSVIEDEHGLMVHKEEEIVQVIDAYFEKIFTTSPGERSATVRQALRPIVSTEDNTMLTAIPSAAKVREAAFSINAEKAPGPDGFSAAFFTLTGRRLDLTLWQKFRVFSLARTYPTTSTIPTSG